jgi:hypothetical protein
MKRFFKILFYTILIAFLLLQFYPRPAKNVSASVNANDITFVHQVPSDVQEVLKKSCYDCHSNNTDYPWYARIQPVAMWLGGHIVDGKKELNFSEFGSYSLRRQYRKLEEIDSETEENHMPLSSYTFIHRSSKLGEAQKSLLANWVTALRDSFKTNYPPDSLERKK